MFAIWKASAACECQGLITKGQSERSPWRQCRRSLASSSVDVSSKILPQIGELRKFLFICFILNSTFTLTSNHERPKSPFLQPVLLKSLMKWNLKRYLKWFLNFNDSEYLFLAHSPGVAVFHEASYQYLTTDVLFSRHSFFNTKRKRLCV